MQIITLTEGSSSIVDFLNELENIAEEKKAPFSILATWGTQSFSSETCTQFQKDLRLFSDDDVVVGLIKRTPHLPQLRVAMKGEANTGLMPETLSQNPAAFEVLALTTNGFDSDFVLGGIAAFHSTILKEKAAIASKKISTPNQLLGHLLRYAYRFYGIPLENA